MALPFSYRLNPFTPLLSRYALSVLRLASAVLERLNISFPGGIDALRADTGLTRGPRPALLRGPPALLVELLRRDEVGRVRRVGRVGRVGSPRSPNSPPAAGNFLRGNDHPS